VLGLTDIIAIAAGSTHSLAVKADGTVWAWGLNYSRQLGDASVGSRSTPGGVSGVASATNVAAGAAHFEVPEATGRALICERGADSGVMAIDCDGRVGGEFEGGAEVGGVGATG